MIEQRFLDHIADGYQAGQRYCFVLGAGAAKASGIRTGEEMMREWHKHVLGKGLDYIRDCAQELNLEEKDYLPLFKDGYVLKNDDYFTLFDLRFAGKPNAAYAYLEKEMEAKYPSYGYFPLAKILSHTGNRLVITTNFDTLLEDALYTYTFKHPLVVGHESLASYIASDFRHPVIAKIHRDLLFRPFNRKQDMDKLKGEWEQPLRNALSRYTPIVIGYAGGDHTFMSLLEEIELNNGIYWCHLGEAPLENAQRIVAKQNGYLVKILGFDEIMFRLGDRFAEEAQFGDPCAYIHEEAEKRCGLYQESLDKIKKKYDMGKSTTEEAPGAGENGTSQSAPGGDRPDEAVADLMDAIDRYDSRQAGGKETSEDIKELESEARRKLVAGDYEQALSLYTQLIEKVPGNASYYEWRSTVLYDMKRYPEAVEDDTKAIALEPDNAEYYHSRAVTLHAMRQYEQALVDRTKAIELEPTSARYYHQRAVTLHEMGRYKPALDDYNKAIELDPNNAKYYHGRAITLHSMNQYEQALADRNKAIELAPSNAPYYDQRAVTLHAMEQYEQALVDRNKAIELAPSNARYYNQRAVTLHAMKQYEQALVDRNKAIEIDPNNASYYYGRAITLYEMKQYEKALLDDTKAVELAPTNAKFYKSRAMTFRKLGRDAEAEQDERKAEELSSHPGDPPQDC